jgi:hypothetical protein
LHTPETSTPFRGYAKTPCMAQPEDATRRGAENTPSLFLFVLDGKLHSGKRANRIFLVIARGEILRMRVLRISPEDRLGQEAFTSFPKGGRVRLTLSSRHRDARHSPFVVARQ